MGTATFTGVGNWSDATGKWVGGTGANGQPIASEAAIIAKNSTLTLDVTTAVCDTLTLNNGTTGADVGAILTCVTTADTKLTLQKKIVTTKVATASYMSSVNLDVSSTNTYKCELVLNNSGSTTAADGQSYLSGNYLLKGYPKTRHTTINSALTANSTKSVVVADATGWKVGDRLVFATTSAYNATPRTDIVTIDTITAGAGTTATVTWIDGVGTGGAVLYDHASSCPVGNFTSNMRVVGANASTKTASIIIDSIAGQQSADCYVDSVEFYQCSNPLTLDLQNAGDNSTAKHKSIKRCAFYDWWFNAIALNYLSCKPDRSYNIFYSANSNATAQSSANSSGIYGAGGDSYYAIFRSQHGIFFAYPDQIQTGHKISGCVASSSGGGPFVNIVSAALSTADAISCDFWSNLESVKAVAPMTYTGCRFDSGVFANATNGNARTIGLLYSGSVTAVDCYVPTAFVAYGVSLAQPGYVFLKNRNADPAIQEYYQYQSTTIAAVQRDTSVTNSATSSLLFTLNSTTAQTYSIQLLAKAATAIKILCYVRKSSAPAYGASTLPFVTMSGLGITPVTATMSGGTAADAWELLTLDLAAGSAPSTDGLLTLTFTAQSAIAGAKAYFSGIPVAPFSSRARHYGYLYDETLPTRTANPTIDPAISSATAAAYTGITVTWNTGTTPSTTALATNDVTFKQLYHYTQSVATSTAAIIGSNMPITGSGGYDAPVLFAQGNISTVSAYKLSGSGSLSMGSYTLSTYFASGVAYTYTGGTFSQATTVPTFSGGTLSIGAAGTYTYTQASAMILSMTPTAPGTYALGATTFTGQVDLRNTAAHAITVELPTGTSYTTASNTGGTITVSLPVVTADISITSMPNDAAGTTRLQIINKTALSASAWAANTVYATGALVKRSTGIGSESTAGLYFRATTGGTSHATTEPTWDTTVGNTTADGTVVWTCYAVLYYDADPAATSLTDTYIDGEEFLDGEVAEIRFAEMNGSTSFKTYSTEVAITAAGFSALVAEEADAVFATFAIDGSTLEATFSPNFTSDYIVLDSNTDFAGKGAFAYYCYTLTTSAGMYNFWGGITALDEGNIRINTSILNLYFDESAGFVKQTDDVRIFRSDGTRPALDPTTGGSGIEINWRTPVSVVTTGGSALTPTESSYLLALPIATDNAIAVLTAAQTTPIHSDVRKVVGITVDGTGTDIDPWGPA